MYKWLLKTFHPLNGYNSLPNDKISDWSKLKAFAEDNLLEARIDESFP